MFTQSDCKPDRLQHRGTTERPARAFHDVAQGDAHAPHITQFAQRLQRYLLSVVTRHDADARDSAVGMLHLLV